MCGIGFCCTVGCTCEIEKVVNTEALRRRGPDVQESFTFRLSDQVTSKVIACILHLRGPRPVKQPVEASNGSWLLWNGEIFSGQVLSGENDTRTLMGLLEKCSDVTSLLSTFSNLHGPWAFIYWQGVSQKLWFGRDMFGRRSLLWKYSRSPQFSFALSSVANRPRAPEKERVDDTDSENWFEVPAYGIYSVDFSHDVVNAASPLLHPWTSLATHLYENRPEADGVVATNGDPFSQMVIQSHHVEPPVSIALNMSLPSPNDLEMYSGALDLFSERGGDLEDNRVLDDVFRTFDELPYVDVVESFERILLSAVNTRIESIPDRCQLCIREDLTSNGGFEEGTQCISESNGASCRHSKIAVLFSGGLDSAVIALLVHRCLPPNESIDLLNVAFEQSSAGAYNFDVPDRISGKESYAELRTLAPDRKWNFVEIDISKEEMSKESESRIYDLVYPLTSVLDSDIGCAIWFAARGKGTITLDQKLFPYTSTARVVLTGMGADEQLAGYSRHRLCFQRKGWPALISELKMEMDRISSRNLGRDDRVISDHGREARFPFLDENVVSFLNSLPVWFKANLNLPRGIGDKFLLRCVADGMHLRTATYLAKRAIQFGSRIAKMEKNRKGSDTFEKLKVKIL